MTVTESCHSNVTPIGELHAEQIAETMWLYVFRMAFPASLLSHSLIRSSFCSESSTHCKSQTINAGGVTCQVSNITCQVSFFLVIFIKKNDKVVKVVGGGSVINASYPVKFFLYEWENH